VLVTRGRRLAPPDVALAAMAGADPVSVFRRPRIVIAVTGNELVPPHETPGPGKLRDSNGPMLVSLCRATGREAVTGERIPDDPEAIRQLFTQAKGMGDVLLTCGGVSTGDLDLLPKEAARSGYTVIFHGVAVRPGKPFIFARRDELIWLGLPGNPVSASVTFHRFVRYALDLLEGAAQPGPAFVTAHLRGDLTAVNRETYRDAWFRTEDGENWVEPLSSAGSHDLAAHARANALIQLPAHRAPVRSGEIVRCLLL
jgi:molybdopterin molybdotransferase